MGVLPPANVFPDSLESYMRIFDDNRPWDVVISNLGKLPNFPLK